MAGDALYPKWKEAVMQGASNSSLAGNLKCVLVDLADYTYDAAHEFLSDVPSGARVSTSGNLASKTYTNGVLDAADITLSLVSGDVSEALIIYIDTGVAATSRLVYYCDVATGLAVTPNGGDINVAWDNGAYKIFQL